VALSPHLDDAVLSIGAFMHQQARQGVDVHVVTVFANDPCALVPAESWDEMCGFTSAAGAARIRREEDRRACAIIGARPHWLPYGDDSYGRRAGDNEIWESIRGLIDGCDLLLVPGFPLRHSDHAWLTRLVVQRRMELTCGLGFYAEQPYASATLRRRGHPEVAAPHPFLEDGVTMFERVPAAGKDRRAKLNASLQYRSQLRALGVSALVRSYLGERLRGGELVARPCDASAFAADDAPQRTTATPPAGRNRARVGGGGESGRETGERAESVGECVVELFGDE
jgi:LmbE family N-acetylglucosaminyl deacetylase